MYIPEYFRETSNERILSLIEGNSFGVLVTASEGVPFVSHLPFIFDHAAGSKGKLYCHLARKNPHWQHIASCVEVLVVFQGPHAYVSPSWYSHPGVPTWNYAVAHLRGTPRLIEDEVELEAIVNQLTMVHESDMPVPWTHELSGEQRTRLLNMIVGLEIEITDIEAKFKLSQNRLPEEQHSIIQQLKQSGKPYEVELAELMSEL